MIGAGVGGSVNTVGAILNDTATVLLTVSTVASGASSVKLVGMLTTRTDGAVLPVRRVVARITSLKSNLQDKFYKKNFKKKKKKVNV